WEPEARAVLEEPHVPTVLEAFREKVAASLQLDADLVKQWLKAVQKETGYKGKQLFMPVRAAVTGRTHGPDLAATIALLGRERVLARLAQTLDSLPRHAGK
nr:glutamate--tRNA ligase [Bacillota bacterium]